jgi:hypothetical protein
MFNWHSDALDLLNLVVIIVTALLIVKDVRKLNRRYHRRCFGPSCMIPQTVPEI